MEGDKQGDRMVVMPMECKKGEKLPPVSAIVLMAKEAGSDKGAKAHRVAAMS